LEICNAQQHAVTVQRLQRDRLQNQHIQRPGEQVGRCLRHAAVADRPRMMVRRKSEDGELLQTLIIRRPTPIDIVSATATRRAVFAMMAAGLAAVASSDMT
jgi:hypothetical protein